MILQKVHVYLNVKEKLQEFCLNRSATDAMFIVHQIVQKTIEYNRPAFMCFVDVKNAFDRVKLSNDITILVEKKVSEND